MISSSRSSTLRLVLRQLEKKDSTFFMCFIQGVCKICMKIKKRVFAVDLCKSYKLKSAISARADRKRESERKAIFRARADATDHRH